MLLPNTVERRETLIKSFRRFGNTSAFFPLLLYTFHGYNNVKDAMTMKCKELKVENVYT